MARAGTAATHQPRHPDGDDSVKDWKVRPAEDEFVRNASALQLEMAGRDVMSSARPSRSNLNWTLSWTPWRRFRRLGRSIHLHVLFLEDGEFALWGAMSLPLLKVNGRDLTAETDGATRRVEAGAPDDGSPER